MFIDKQLLLTSKTTGTKIVQRNKKGNPTTWVKKKQQQQMNFVGKKLQTKIRKLFFTDHKENPFIKSRQSSLL